MSEVNPSQIIDQDLSPPLSSLIVEKSVNEQFLALPPEFKTEGMSFLYEPKLTTNATEKIRQGLESKALPPQSPQTDYREFFEPNVRLPSDPHFRYVIENEYIGFGGQGRIHRGWDLKMQRWVAIKRLSGWFRSSLLSQHGLEREAKTYAKLEDLTSGLPYTIQVYDFLEQNSAVYLIMEYLDPKVSPTLDHILKEMQKNGQRLPMNQVMNILTQLAEAVDDMAKKGFFHKDLKPENIFLKNFNSHDFQVKIGDVGVSNWAEPDMISGTPLYMAPEMHDTSESNVRAETFTIALMAYEMLSGTPLFEALGRVILGPAGALRFYKSLDFKINEHSQLYQHLEAIGADVNACEIVFARALNPDPNKRYETAVQFVVALEKVLQPKSPSRQGLSSSLWQKFRAKLG